MVLSQTSTAHTDDLLCEVVDKLAEVEDVDPLKLTPPLYEVIDTDALERLFDNDRVLGEFTFDYNGHEVSVLSDGDVSVKSDGT